MDEQECILEIVDGVLTIVPKDKSTSSSINSDGEKNRKKQKHIKHSKRKYKRRFVFIIKYFRQNLLNIKLNAQHRLPPQFRLHHYPNKNTNEMNHHQHHHLV